ncbi:MAG: MFS transporter, partial [Coriobacteriales bacterium]|nr:MFS transporter [Coriobacteriales bacterium]
MNYGANSIAQPTGNLKSRRILYLAFATIALLVLGLIYAWSIFATPIGKDYETYKPFLGQVFQVSMFLFCVSALLGAQIIRRKSAKTAIITAASLLGIGFILTAFLSQFSVVLIFIFYGVLAASGVGIAYNAIISLINPWFPDRIGLASGIMMMGFGVSALVFGALANLAFKYMSWKIVFIIIAIAGAIILVALALIIKPAPKD